MYTRIVKPLILLLALILIAELGFSGQDSKPCGTQCQAVKYENN